MTWQSVKLAHGRFVNKNSQLSLNCNLNVDEPLITNCHCLTIFACGKWFYFVCISSHGENSSLTRSGDQIYPDSGQSEVP